MTFYLDLHDGRPPIPCRDAHQADLLRGIWRARRAGIAADMGLLDERSLEYSNDLHHPSVPPVQPCPCDLNEDGVGSGLLGKAQFNPFARREQLGNLSQEMGAVASIRGSRTP